MPKFGKGWKRHRRRKDRKKGRNWHHLVPKSRSGRYTDANLLLIDIERHKNWHGLWGNRTLEEVLQLLNRLSRMKANQSRFGISEAA